MPCAEQRSLDEALGAFELRGFSAGPQRPDPGRLEPVPQSGNQRPFGADHREIDSPLFGEGDQPVQIGDGDRHAFRHFGDSGVARRAIELRHDRTRRQRPRQRMLPSAGTDEKDVQGNLVWRTGLQPCLRVGVNFKELSVWLILYSRTNRTELSYIIKDS